MQRIYIMRGLPGSGKTTVAGRILELFDGRVFRVNRDAIRQMLWLDAGWSKTRESIVRSVEKSVTAALLLNGVDVIVDDTNLDRETVSMWEEIAVQCSSSVFEVDLRDRPVEVCIERDAKRGADGGKSVGEAVIRKLAARLETQDTKVTPDATTPDSET